MIYITEEYCHLSEGRSINKVWQVDSNSVEEDYKAFMLQEAEKHFEIVINPHWLNIMNHKNHHPHLSSADYKSREKAWKKYLNTWPVEKYIEEILEGVQLEYKTLLI